MAEKSIYLAGRPIPIQTEANVSTFMDGGFSFYNLAGTAKPSDYQQMLAMRPAGRVFSNRKSPNGYRLSLDVSQMNQAGQQEMDELQQTARQVVLHHDVTYSSEMCFSVLVSRGLSTHFMINHDGTIHQPMDIYHSAWATGKNNNWCIAIDVNNPAKLEMAGKDPANPPRQVFQGRVNGSQKVALGYTEAQYGSLIALLRALIQPIRIQGASWIPLATLASNCFPPYNADGEVINRLIRNHTEFVGFMGHWHCEAKKWDPGPGFDWNKVVAGVHGERNSFPVILPDGANIPELSGQSFTDELERFYANIEGSEEGGWYPIGANQSWHSGVHIHVDEGTPVYAMSAGTIVAVRNVPRVDLGDASFVLVRHERESNTTVIDEEAEDEEPRYWWSLYMHLKRAKTVEELSQLRWAQTLLSGNFEQPGDSMGYDDLTGDSTPREKLGPRTADGTKLNEFMDNPKPFWDGDIILTEIPVESGEQIGFVGRFGSNEWNQEPQLHVEAISPRNIFDDAPDFSREWRLVEGDKDNSSLADIPNVIKPIISAAATGYDDGGSDDLTGSRVLKTSEIQSFFLDGSAMSARRTFRKMVCVHQSEWSPETDWRATAATAVGWQWETQEAFSRWMFTWWPFQWMTPQVTSHAGLPENHRVYTYHPIYMLAYLNQSYSGPVGDVQEGASDAELAADKAEAERIQARLKELVDKRASGEELTPEEDMEYRELVALADAHTGSDEADTGTDDFMFDYDGSFDQWEPGEWEPPKKDDPTAF